MKILLISNDGGGFADRIDIEPGTTMASLFAAKMPGRKSQDFLIRINRQPASSDQVLQSDDRVSFTPVKIVGAF